MSDRRLPTSILCFGDSLTAGYQSPRSDASWATETPYGLFLQERLGSAAHVSVSGICGELTSEMVSRFHRDVLTRHPDYVVILGGTNDLGWNVPTDEIVRNLFTMYEQAKTAGIQPIALTVPSLRGHAETDAEAATWLREHIARRHTLNRAIERYCSAQSLRCVDVFGATSEPTTHVLAARYSNDGLHLTTDGYRAVADLLYREVFVELAT